MSGQSGACRDCRDFDSDPARLEEELGGLAALSSAFGATRLGDGFCRRHDRHLSGHACCEAFSAATSQE